MMAFVSINTFQTLTIITVLSCRDTFITDIVHGLCIVIFSKNGSNDSCPIFAIIDLKDIECILSKCDKNHFSCCNIHHSCTVWTILSMNLIPAVLSTRQYNYQMY